MDDNGSLKIIKDDDGILDLVNQLVRQSIVDVYVECSDVNHGDKLPDTLMPCPVGSHPCEAEDVEGSSIMYHDKLADTSMASPHDYRHLDVTKNYVIEQDNISEEDDDDILVDVPIVGSDVDDERD